jgi:hypothetical protein
MAYEIRGRIVIVEARLKVLTFTSISGDGGLRGLLPRCRSI